MSYLAEGQGFEPWMPLDMPVFKTDPRSPQHPVFIDIFACICVIPIRKSEQKNAGYRAAIFQKLHTYTPSPYCTPIQPNY